MFLGGIPFVATATNTGKVCTLCAMEGHCDAIGVRATLVRIQRLDLVATVLYSKYVL